MRSLRHTHSEADNVGVQDFVLLDDFRSEDAFIENLKKRFNKDVIYTYISNVVISVNPYHQLSIYTPDYIRIYQNVNLYELPPHVYVLFEPRNARTLSWLLCEMSQHGNPLVVRGLHFSAAHIQPCFNCCSCLLF